MDAIIDLKRDGLRAVGDWESYPNRIRAGQHQPDVPGFFEWTQSEEFVRGLAERGYNLYITQFSKGFGIETERPHMERTRKLAELCHRYNIALGGYTRYSTIIPETLSREVPDCLERFAGRTGAGQYARYGRMYWRYIPCPCSEEWLAYFTRVIDIAVNEVKMDFLAIDGPTLWPEPEACHCPRCREAFRAYLKQKYPDAGTRCARFGFDTLDFIEPPYYGLPADFKAPRALNDPVAQEWLLFRCDRLTHIFSSLVASAKKLRPEIWVEGNIKYEPGANTAWLNSNDLFALHQTRADAFYTEEPNSPELRDDGAILSYIATFKKARQHGKRVLCYNRGGPPAYRDLTEPAALACAYAQELAFAFDSLGCAVTFSKGGFPVSLPAYFDFHRQHRELYRESGRHLADAGVYYSTRSLAFSMAAPHLALVLAQQALIQTRVPFNYIFAEEVDRLQEYRTVVLPEVECLSDAEISALAEYARRGGGLVIVGATGSCDPWRRLRATNVLAEALGLAWKPGAGGGWTAEIGLGRVAYLPRLSLMAGSAETRGSRGEWVEDFAKGSVHGEAMWRGPREITDLMAMIRWTARDLTVEVLAPHGVIAEFIRQAESRLLIHLVNFDLRNDVAGVEIRCRGYAGQSAAALTPDEGGVQLSSRSDNKDLVIRLQSLRRYAVVIVRPG